MRLFAEFINRQGHVVRTQECLIIGINQTTERRFLFRQFPQLWIAEFVPSCRPRLPATLQHPKAHYIFQESRRSIYAAFVGEVQFERLRGN